MCLGATPSPMSPSFSAEPWRGNEDQVCRPYPSTRQAGTPSTTPHRFPICELGAEAERLTTPPSAPPVSHFQAFKHSAKYASNDRGSAG